MSALWKSYPLHSTRTPKLGVVGADLCVGPLKDHYGRVSTLAFRLRSWLSPCDLSPGATTPNFAIPHQQFILIPTPVGRATCPPSGNPTHSTRTPKPGVVRTDLCVGPPKDNYGTFSSLAFALR